MPTAARKLRAEARRRFELLHYSRNQQCEDNIDNENIRIIPSGSTVVSRLITRRKRRLHDFRQYMDNKFFKDDLHGYCFVCDRIWWSNMLRQVKEDDVAWNYLKFIGYDPTETAFKVCSTCHRDLRCRRTPKMATINGFVYPDVPSLPPLCPITERLVSPRLPFMCIRNVRYFEGSRKLYGQVINVPVDVDSMVQLLPRRLEDDMAFNVRIKKRLIANSTYLSGCVSKTIVKEWLRYLVETPLYQRHNIKIKCEFLDKVPGQPDQITPLSPQKAIHRIVELC